MSPRTTLALPVLIAACALLWSCSSSKLASVSPRNPHLVYQAVPIGERVSPNVRVITNDSVPALKSRADRSPRAFIVIVDCSGSMRRGEDGLLHAPQLECIEMNIRMMAARNARELAVLDSSGQFIARNSFDGSANDQEQLAATIEAFRGYSYQTESDLSGGLNAAIKFRQSDPIRMLPASLLYVANDDLPTVFLQKTLESIAQVSELPDTVFSVVEYSLPFYSQGAIFENNLNFRHFLEAVKATGGEFVAVQPRSRARQLPPKIRGLPISPFRK